MKPCSVNHRAQARGYLLVEMLVIIGLMGIALLIEAQLFRTAMKLISSEPAAANETVSLNHLTTQLRRDVWASHTIETPDANTLVLTLSDSQSVRWSFGNSGIDRTDSAAGTASPAHWDVQLSLAPRRDGAYVVLISSMDQNGANVGQRRFASPMLLAQARTEVRP